MDKKFLRQVGTLFSGTVVAQGITYGVSLLLVRFFSPAQFGEFTYFLTLTSVLSILASANYEYSIILTPNKKDAFLISFFTLLLNLGFNLFLFLLLLIVSPARLCTIFPIALAPKFLWFVPLSVFFISTFRILTHWYNRIQGYSMMSISNVSRSLSATIFQLFWGVFRKGTIGLILGEVLGQIVRGGILLVRFLPNYLIYRKKIKLAKVKVLARRYSKFPKFAIISEFIGFLSSQLPSFLFPVFYNTDVLGMYAAQNRLLLLPLSMLGGAVAQVYFREAADLKHDTKKLQELTFGIFKKSFLLAVVPFCVITVFGDRLIPILFGQKWVMAGVFSQYLSLWLLFVFVSSPLSAIFNIMELQKQSLYFNTVLFMLRFASIFIVAKCGFDAYTTVFWFGLSGFLYFFFFAFYVFYLIGYPLQKIATFIFGISIPILIILFSIRHFLGL